MLRRVIDVVLLGGGKVIQNKKVRKAASAIAEEGLKKGTKVIKEIKTANKKNERMFEEIIAQLKDRIEEQEKEIEIKNEQIIKLKEELLVLQHKKHPSPLKRLFGKNK